MKAPEDYSPEEHLAFLLSAIYDSMPLHPEHQADLAKSGITDATRRAQKIRSLPPGMIPQLLGFAAPKVTIGYLIPYADPAGGWMPHVRVKVFPAITEGDGPRIRYLQPPRSGIRVFFPVIAMPSVIGTDADLWVVEGEKKALAVAQRGLPAIGIAGITCWGAPGTRRLHADFDHVPLMGRIVELVPDSDWQSNARVRAAVGALATALSAAGARPRVVVLPDEVSA